MSQDMEREVMEDLATGTQPSPADESFEAFEEEGLEGGDTMEEEFCIFSSISASCVHGNRTPMFMETGQPFS
jgi:hypothetical protein